MRGGAIGVGMWLRIREKKTRAQRQLQQIGFDQHFYLRENGHGDEGEKSSRDICVG